VQPQLFSSLVVPACLHRLVRKPGCQAGNSKRLLS